MTARGEFNHNSGRLFIGFCLLVWGLSNPAAVKQVGDAIASSGEDFAKAMKFTEKWEGGFSDHASDVGGRTMKGVTQSTFNSYLSSKGQGSRDVATMTESERLEIYKRDYWQAGGCDRKPWPLSLVCFDSVVNFGVGGGKSFFAEAPLPTDARQAALEVVKRRKNYRYQRVTENPGQRVFLHGWLNRDNDLEQRLSNGDRPK